MMKFVSTRKQAPVVPFSEALKWGLASDGGLYVPEHFPQIDIERFESLKTHAEFGAELLRPFLSGDPLASHLDSICQNAFRFPIPLRYLKDQTSILELFHGPTAAFKDVGARFLAECIAHGEPSSAKRTVLVATSGDTGGAVAGAFHDQAGLDVVVLYPKGKISARQEKQIASWGGNVCALAVKGDFDDCQRLVKEALGDSRLRETRTFISANSISVGRLLPQMIYYAKASLDHIKDHGQPAGFIIPTGNLGNAVAALWAKRLGFPIQTVVLATNANRPIPDYFASGNWQPRATLATLANAMDVGHPSNMERLLQLYPRLEELKEDVAAESVNDEEISAAIREGRVKWGEIFCPHTAIAFVVRERMMQRSSTLASSSQHHPNPAIGSRATHWICVATAHPAKFETIVEPLIARSVEIPEALAALLNRSSRSVDIEPSSDALKAFLES